jgi:hypothetical protein
MRMVNLDTSNLKKTIEESLEKCKKESFVTVNGLKLKKWEIEFVDHIWVLADPEKSKEYVKEFEFYLESRKAGMVSVRVVPILHDESQVVIDENILATYNIVALGTPFVANAMFEVIKRCADHL